MVTGIARPDRFVADISSTGWEIAGVMEFRDHHAFDRRDIARITAAARAASAALVLTTEKDAVRLTACDLGDLPIASVPLNVGIEPANGFHEWLLARLRAHPASPPASPPASHPAPSTLHGTRHPAPGTRHRDP